MNQLKVHVALNVNDLEKIWIADPNGYRWEFFVVKIADTKPELTFAGAHESATKARSCCAPDCCA